LTRTARGHHQISIPLEIAAEIGLAFGGPVSLDVENGKIIVAPAKVVQNDRT
jgi:antitoxin component of MazEF toxin-antitoxin module